MNTKKLKQLVLDLAIHGKLVPQDPNDEPASELLKRIQADVETHGRASNKSKGKKSAVSSVDLDEVPFEVPEGWCWTRLIEVCSVFSTGPFGSMVHKSDYVFDKGVPLINPANIKDGKIDSDKLMFVSEAKSIELSRYRLSVNDVLLARRGDLSKCAIVSSKEENWLCGTGSFFLRLIFIQPEFFLSFYSTNYLQSILSSESVGATMDNLNQGLLGNVLFPLPPLAEQHRIVAAIEKWFAVIDQLEKNEADLKKSIEQTKKKVLDLAIRGKLVAQDAEDEPARESIKAINPKAEILFESDEYGEVPEGWCLTPLESFIEYEQPQKYIVESTKYSDSYRTPVLTAGKSFVLGYTNEVENTYKNVPVIIFDDFTTDSRYVDFEFKVKSSAMKILQVNPIVDIKYISYFMSITRLIGDTHKRFWISEYSKILAPIPPLAEQKRIVEKIEEVFGALERIEGMMC